MQLELKLGLFMPQSIDEPSPIHGILSNPNAIDVRALQILLKEHPEAVHELDNNGKTPLHIAIERNDLAVVDCLIKKGASPDSLNPQGVTALRTAVLRNNDKIVKLLVKHSINISSGFDPIFYLSANRYQFLRNYIFVMLMVAVLASVIAIIISMFWYTPIIFNGISPLIAFKFTDFVYAAANTSPLQLVLMVLKSDVFLRVVNGYFISMLIVGATAYLGSHSDTIGHLGRQHRAVLSAIDSKNVPALKLLLSENIHWLITPVRPLGISALTSFLCCRSDAVRQKFKEMVMQKLPEMVNNKLFIERLLASTHGRELLIKYPDLMFTFIDNLSMESLAEHKEVLFDLIFDTLTYWRANPDATLQMMAKLTVQGMGWGIGREKHMGSVPNWALRSEIIEKLISPFIKADEEKPYSFMPKRILEATGNNDVIHLAQGYIYKQGSYGCPVNSHEAIKAFSQVSRADTAYYFVAQKEMKGLHFSLAGEHYSKSDLNGWIEHFYEALSHSRTILSETLNDSQVVERNAQLEVTQMLDGLVPDIQSQERIYEDLKRTDHFKWKTTKQEQPVLLAAHFDHWYIVSKIIEEHFETIDPAHYHILLTLAKNANEKGIESLLFAKINEQQVAIRAHKFFAPHREAEVHQSLDNQLGVQGPSPF